MNTTTQSGLTQAQTDMLETLDDVSEHVAVEFDPDEYRGFSTCGFAHIPVDGRSSFVRRIKSLSDSQNPSVLYNDRRGSWEIQVGGLELSLTPGHSKGYRLSVLNVKDYISGPAYQRMDVRERLNGLVLERLQYNGYLENTRVRSRMD